MTDVLSPDAGRFMDALAIWLLARKDPRIRVWTEGETQRCSIDNLAACAADFCEAKAQEAEAAEKK